MSVDVEHYINIFTGESTRTIREALDALDAVDPVDAVHAEKILAIRAGLLRKLDEASGLVQGSLF